MALKRDSKGRFLKRGARKKARARNAPRKKRAGLKGHKPGCRCVIHARRRRVARNTARRRPARKVQRNFSRRKPSLLGRVLSGAVAEIRLSAKETKGFGAGDLTWDRVYARSTKILRGKQKGSVLVRSAGGKVLARFERKDGSVQLHR